MYVKGYRVKAAYDLDSTLEEAFKQHVPVVDCQVDYGENIKLTEHLEEVYKIF